MTLFILGVGAGWSVAMLLTGWWVRKGV